MSASRAFGPRIAAGEDSGRARFKHERPLMRAGWGRMTFDCVPMEHCLPNELRVV
jgi:hypothetical protein